MRINLSNIVLLWSLNVMLLFAQVPNLINYQGMLRNSEGQPLNMEVTVIFSIYDSQTNGAKLWEEDRTITPVNGLFNVLLGSVTNFPANMFTDHNELYLALQVGTDEEMKTRFRLGSVAFAMNSASAEEVPNGSITLNKISKSGASQGSALMYDGTNFTWQSPPGGDITRVIAGNGLSGGGTTGDVTLSIANNGVNSDRIQNGEVKRVDLENNVIDSTKIDNGSVTLDKINNSGASSGDALMYNGTGLTWQTPEGAGDITRVTAAGGLSGGGDEGDVTLSIASGGVNSDRILDGGVGNEDLAENAVNSSKIEDLSIEAVDLNANSVNSSKINNYSIFDVDISASAAIAPGKIDGTAWTGANDGAGSGLDADLLDGQQASFFINVGSDYGRSGVTTDLYEGTSTLSSRYVNEGQSNSITGSMISTNAVGADEIASGAVGSSEVADGSLTHLDIQNEPGIEYSTVWGPQIPDTPSELMSVTVTAPTAGYVVVSVDGWINWLRNSTGYGWLRFEISTNSGEIPSNADLAITNTETVTGQYYKIPFSVSKVFTVSAGSTSFYFNGNQNQVIGIPHLAGNMVALFVPTRY